MKPCAHCPITGNLVCPAIARNVPGYCGWVEPGGKRYHPNGAATLEAMAQGSASTPVTTPRLRDMAVSLAGTLVQEVKHVITGGHVRVSEETFQKRVAICRGERDHWDRCRHLQERPRLRCHKCGCDGEIAFRMPVKACPIGRWPAETEGH